jgi:predicted HicB family RNase H-like nuclease
MTEATKRPTRPTTGAPRVKFNARICGEVHERARALADREHAGNFSAAVESLMRAGLRQSERGR